MTQAERGLVLRTAPRGRFAAEGSNHETPPWFSVIIPAFNRRDTIDRCIQSVLAQEFDSFELVVVDDGSVDGTWEAIEAIRDPRLVGLHQGNRGVSLARNRGVAHAKGVNVVFLDSDDEALPGWLATLAGPLKDPRCGVVCCSVEDVAEGIKKIRRPENLGAAFEDQVGLFLPGSYAVRRDVFWAVGGFAPEVVYGEHHELALRLIPYCVEGGLRVSALEDPLVMRHRASDPRARLKGYRQARYESVVNVVGAHRGRLSKSPALLSNYLANAGVSAIGMGKQGVGRRLLLEAVGVRPTDLRNYLRFAASFVPSVTRRLW